MLIKPQNNIHNIKSNHTVKFVATSLANSENTSQASDAIKQPVASQTSQQIKQPLHLNNSQQIAKSAINTTSPVHSQATSNNATINNNKQAQYHSMTSQTGTKSINRATVTRQITTTNKVKINHDISTTKQGMTSQQVINHNTVSLQVVVKSTSQSQTTTSLANNKATSMVSQQHVTKIKAIALPTTNDTHNEQANLIQQTVTYVPTHSLGVDTSAYNQISSNSYRADNCKFNIIKLTEGTDWENWKASQQITSAANNHLMVLGYSYAHFGGNAQQAIDEAHYTINYANQVGLPQHTYIACDYEADASNSKLANTYAILAFMRTIKHYGFQPLLYSGENYMNTYIDTNLILKEFPNSLWIASYATTAPVSLPNFHYFPTHKGVIIWQFSDHLDNQYNGVNLDPNNDVDGDVNVLPLIVPNANQQPQHANSQTSHANSMSNNKTSHITTSQSTSMSNSATSQANSMSNSATTNTSSYASQANIAKMTQSQAQSQVVNVTINNKPTYTTYNNQQTINNSNISSYQDNVAKINNRKGMPVKKNINDLKIVANHHNNNTNNTEYSSNAVAQQARPTLDDNNKQMSIKPLTASYSTQSSSNGNHEIINNNGNINQNVSRSGMTKKSNQTINNATLPTTSELNNNDDLAMLTSVVGGSAIISALLKFNKKNNND